MIEKMVAFAYNYKGLLTTRILLSQNILNNLCITFDRSKDTIQFSDIKWDAVKDIKYPFAGFFKDDGFHQANLFVEDEAENINKDD
jgi:hypothetical protein